MDLTSAVVERAVVGLLEVLDRRGLPSTVALARDERPTGEALAGEVVEVARREGADVLDLGVVSTPAAKHAARRRRVGGAVIVTGSHLDPELNGLKLVAGPAYGPLDVSRLPESRRHARRVVRGRLSREHGAAAEHVSAVCASVDAGRIRASGMAVDAVGGAGPGGELLLDALGCRRPGRDPDVTLRLDADGDRLGLVDERGEALEPELVLPLAILARAPRTVVKGADTSRTVDAVAARRGTTVVVVPPGELHLAAGVQARGADLAGEGNGGVLLPAVGLARDGLAASAAVLSLLARREQPLSEIASELPRFRRRRSVVPYTDPEQAGRALIALAGRLGSDLADPHEGVSVERAGEVWGLVRMSATEPVVRVTAEAPADAQAEALHEELHAALSRGAANP